MIIESDSAPATVTGVSGLIDTHCHFPARAYRQAVERSGTSVGGVALPAWNAEQTLDVMGDVGIEYSVLSPPSPTPEFDDVDEARRAAREFNEELADQIADDPAAYGGVAYLPLPYVDAALEELAYAIDVLKLDGAHLVTNYRGRYPGDPVFTPLLEELDRRGTTVVTHPTCPPGLVLAGGSMPMTLEFVFETTRLASTLLHSGALRRHPDIRWILAHGGATILQTSHLLYDMADLVQDGATDQCGPRDDAGYDLLRRLHVDLVWNVDEPMLSGLAGLQGSDKLLFGSNMPVERPTRVVRGITTLMRSDAVDDEVKRAAARDNALRLFPSVARKLQPRAAG